MPHKPARQCRIPFCPNLTHNVEGFCDVHASNRGIKRGIENRPTSVRRGYGREWQKIRKETLIKFSIPCEDWTLYDIDHTPRYNPAIEPDHRKYQLTPRLHGRHSQKTILEDGGLGHALAGGGYKSLEPSSVNRSVSSNSRSTDSRGKGVRHG